MKQVMSIIFIISFPISSCKQIYYYRISNDSLQQRQFGFKDSNGVEYNFSGHYFWVLNHTIISEITVRVTNSSSKHIIFRTGNARLESVNFSYVNKSSIYEKILLPGESDVFGLSFWSEVEPPFPEGTEPKIPNNEKVKLIVEGSEIDDKAVSIKPIELIPEVNTN